MDDGKVNWLGGYRLKMVAPFFFFFFFFHASAAKTPVRTIPGPSSSLSPGVQLRASKHPQVIIDNGIVQVIFSKPDGDVIGIKYNGIDNVLESLNERDNRGYWDIVWNKPGHRIIFDKIAGTDFSIIMEDEDQVEISFSKKWRLSVDDNSSLPLNIDKRYIIRRGSSGIYMYAILERLEGWPDVDMDQIRVVFKLQKDIFHFMAVSDERQRIMPMPEDRATGQPLAYPEAVLLTRPINPELRGEVDDKYQYSCEDKDNKVHGWISEDPPVGFWMITPSNEFRVGGPIKQDLTSHVGPVVLNMFTSTHYSGKDLNTAYRNGEPWKKVLGPVFVYLNSVSPSENSSALWEDAKRQMWEETRSWPYSFAQSDDFPTSDQRGTVIGQLIVRDRYINKRLMYASSAYVGLAAPGELGSWQKDAKGYQFWTRATRKGRFTIENVRAGNYSLYAWVPGIIGDYKYDVNITIEPGSRVNLGVLIYDPPRNGPTLWEIGIPERTAAEFYVPDTYPTLMNKLYTNHTTDKFRQYGLWERYNDLYPERDLTYTVGVDNYLQDWFFAHVTRDMGNKTYQATTWKIVFELDTVNHSGNYTLQLALASATLATLHVRINDPGADQPLYTTGLIGQDNAIARHGIHGLYWLFSIDVPSDQLFDGSNTIFLTQSKKDGPFHGVMYDYIRLEGPRDT